MAKKIVLVFLVSFIGIIAGAYLLTHVRKMTLPAPSDHYYSIWNTKEAMVHLLTDREDTIVFGDSTAQGGINPRVINPHVYNFAIDGNSPLEGYFFLKYMIGQGKRPKNIVLSYNLYSYMGGNFWDQILGFDSVLINREAAKEILIHDQATDKKISPYSMGYQQHKPGDAVRIPYYYDIAAGPLKHVSLDFPLYTKKFMAYYNTFRHQYKAHGWGFGGTPDGLVKDNTQTWCAKDKKVPNFSTQKTPFYLNQLVDLANENHINVYLLGGPIPESCAALGFSLAPAYGVDTNQLKLAGIQNKIPVPDKFMFNSTHLNPDGAYYYSGKIKPFFDSIQ